MAQERDRQVSVYYNPEEYKQLERESADNGFVSPSAYIRWAARQQLKGASTLERIAAAIESIIGKKVE